MGRAVGVSTRDSGARAPSEGVHMVKLPNGVEAGACPSAHAGTMRPRGPRPASSGIFTAALRCVAGETQVDHSSAEGLNHRGGAVGYAELDKQPCKMSLDSRLADVETRRNLSRREPGGDQKQHLPFAVCDMQRRL